MKNTPKWESILSDIDKLNNKQPDGFSVQEMSDSVGRSTKWCRLQIKKMIEEGVVKYNGKRRGVNISNDPSYTPVYRKIKD